MKRFQLFSNLFLTYFASGCNHKSVFWELVTCQECQDRGWLAILDTHIDLLWGCPQSRQDVGESIFTSLHPCPLGHTLVWPPCALRHLLWPVLNSETRILKWVFVSSTELLTGSYWHQGFHYLLTSCVHSFLFSKAVTLASLGSAAFNTLQTKQKHWGKASSASRQMNAVCIPTALLWKSVPSICADNCNTRSY